MSRKWMGLALGPAVMAASALSAHAQESSIIADSTLVGQNFNAPSGPHGTMDTGPGKFDFILEGNVYYKNLELIDLGPIEGQTFFGTQLSPRFRFMPTDTIAIEVGAVLQQNFGDSDAVDDGELLVRITAEPAPNFSLVAGTLLPTHPMQDALLDDTQKFRDLTEQGLQFRVNGDVWKQDTWINWRIREGSVNAEEFEVGNTTQLRLFGDAVRLDGQVLWSHAGGQISSSSRVDQNVAGLVGVSVGAKQPMGMEAVTDARIGVSALFSYNDTKFGDPVNGSGYEVRATADIAISDSALLRLSASHFSGDELVNHRGDPLYSLDTYSQVGANAVWKLGDNLRIEAAQAFQHTDSNWNYTTTINLVFGLGFDLGWMGVH